MDTPYSTMNQVKHKQGTVKAGLSQDDITDPSWEVDSTVPASEYINTDHASECDINALASDDDINGRAITESTSETTAESSSANYSAENSNLQFGEDHASRGLSPDQDAKKPSVDNLELNRIYFLLNTPDSEAYRAYKSNREGNLSLQDLASEVCLVLTGSHDQTDAYVEPVRRMVEELAIDDAVSH